MREKSASASSAGGSATRAACRGMLDHPFSTSPACKLKRAPLPRGGRRRDRAGEGGGAARVRRRSGARRARRRPRAARARGRGLDPLGERREYDPADLEGTFMVIASTDGHRREHRHLRGRRAAGDAREHRGPCRRCATSSSRRSSAPARWRSRSPRPALRPRLPSASATRSPTSTESPTPNWPCCSTSSCAAGRRGHAAHLPGPQAFFESIVNGEPDPVELLRQGDVAAVCDLDIGAAQQTHAPA